MDGLETEVIEIIWEIVMDLSIIIVSYNVSSFLYQALTTLSDAFQDLEVEVYVVDNASTDNSVEMVKQKYPWVNLIENDRNLGFASATNLALARVRGRHILLLNPDTVLRRDTLKTMVDFMDAHPEAGAAGCKVINPDGSLQLACRRGFPTPGVAFFKMIGLSVLFPKSKTFGAYNLTYLDPDSLAEVDAVSGSFMMLRKEVIDKVGVLDEDFFMYGEDLDICYRIKQEGWKIYYVPFTEIIHFKGESTKTVHTLKSIRDFYKAMHIFVNKHNVNRAKMFFPRFVLVAGIYFRMAWVYGIKVIKSNWQLFVDLFLLNVSLVLGIILRYGITLENIPNYSRLQWITVFIVYSILYILTFSFIGMYHRYRNVPERALLGIFMGFLFHVFIINFVNNYNFSRSVYSYDIVGCVEISHDVIRGSEKDGVHVLGLVDELSDIIKEYSVNVVIIAGSQIPFSKILSMRNRFSSMRPEFKLVPELKLPENVKDKDTITFTMIDILP